jgi:hypothetical protein
MQNVRRITFLQIINKIIPIRMSVYEEVLGADLVEHRIHHSQVQNRCMHVTSDAYGSRKRSSFLNSRI